MSRHSYAGAYFAGKRAGARYGMFAIEPFWRGWKYRKAWHNGYAMGLLSCWWCCK